jgi:drug/metabolite transporter superfamily protein YnfA
MPEPIKNPVKKWAATMTLVALEVVLLVVIGFVLFAVLPVSEFGTIMAVLAGLAIALSLLTARVIRWLSED